MNKIAKAVLIAIGSIMIAIVLIIALAIVRQTKKLEKSFNNPIIDNNYQGWDTVNLDNHIEVKVPNAWELEYSDDRIYVIDGAGKQIAVGAKLPCFPVEEERAFLGTVFEGTCIERNLLWTSGLIYKNMAATQATELKFDDGRIETYVAVDLPYHYDYKYFFCFFSDNSGTLFRNEVEAIAYSMSYT